jgi:hypothetical protein
MWLTALSFGARALPFLKSPKVIAGGVLLAAAIGLWFYVGALKSENTQLAEDRNMYMTWYQIAAEKNATNQEAIRLLIVANEDLARSVIVSEAERMKAVKDAADRELEARLALDDTLDVLEDLRNETPSCAELSKIDIGAMCPLATERLRQHASGAIGRDGND